MYDAFTCSWLWILSIVAVILFGEITTFVRMLFLRIEILVAVGLVYVGRHLDLSFCDTSFFLSKSEFAVQVLNWKEEYRLLWILPQKYGHFQ